MGRPKKRAVQGYNLDGNLKALFSEEYVHLISAELIDEDGNAGRALLKMYKPFGARERELGPSKLIKATFYMNSIANGPGLLTVVNRCYGISKDYHNPVAVLLYQQEVEKALNLSKGKLSSRLRSIKMKLILK